MIGTIQKMIEPLKRRLLLMIGKGYVNRVDDSTYIQTMQIDFGNDELRDDVARVQSYGFTSVPLEGAEAITLFPGGNRANGIVIAVEDRRYRIKGLEGGEVAIYTDEGDQIYFKRGNTIQVKTQNFEVDTGKMKITSGSNEFVSILSELIGALITARTATMGGPQPLLNPSDPFDTIKSKIDSFKA